LLAVWVLGVEEWECKLEYWRVYVPN
jgi:hypothetical protein